MNFQVPGIFSTNSFTTPSEYSEEEMCNLDVKIKDATTPSFDQATSNVVGCGGSATVTACSGGCCMSVCSSC